MRNLFILIAFVFATFAIMGTVILNDGMFHSNGIKSVADLGASSVIDKIEPGDSRFDIKEMDTSPLVEPIPRKSSPKPKDSGMSEAQAKEWIAMQESSGRYDAVSPDGKYLGRYQLSKELWLQGINEDWLLHTEAGHSYQEQVANSYVLNRYGSWRKAQQFWANNGWY